MEKKRQAKWQKKTFRAEEIINKLHEAEVLTSQGKTVSKVCRALWVSDQTYYCWRKDYGGMSTEQARRLKEFEHENAHLRKVVADLSLDNSILKETLRMALDARPNRFTPHFCPPEPL